MHQRADSKGRGGTGPEEKQKIDAGGKRGLVAWLGSETRSKDRRGRGGGGKGGRRKTQRPGGRDSIGREWGKQRYASIGEANCNHQMVFSSAGRKMAGPCALILRDSSHDFHHYWLPRALAILVNVLGPDLFVISPLPFFPYPPILSLPPSPVLGLLGESRKEGREEPEGRRRENERGREKEAHRAQCQRGREGGSCLAI